MLFYLTSWNIIPAHLISHKHLCYIWYCTVLYVLVQPNLESKTFDYFLVIFKMTFSLQGLCGLWLHLENNDCFILTFPLVLKPLAYLVKSDKWLATCGRFWKLWSPSTVRPQYCIRSSTSWYSLCTPWVHGWSAGYHTEIVKVLSRS